MFITSVCYVTTFPLQYSFTFKKYISPAGIKPREGDFVKPNIKKFGLVLSPSNPLFLSPPTPHPYTPSNPISLSPLFLQKRTKLIDVNLIDKIPSEYPKEFTEFCLKNGLKPPNITTAKGKALSVMLKYKFYYWNRDTCNKIVEKFNISTKDSIQLFNKHNQWGIKTNSGIERGKLYIVYPYCLSNKHKMRKNFMFSGTEEEKNNEINKIKSTIKIDYIDVPNTLWQLGHKNPGAIDNTDKNLVLQPPIQGKYRDNYIFIDTLTKIPVPHKLQSMIEKKEIEFTAEQIMSYKQLFDNLFICINTNI